MGKFNPQNPHKKKAGVMAWVCNPGAVETETGEFGGLSFKPV